MITNRFKIIPWLLVLGLATMICCGDDDDNGTGSDNNPPTITLITANPDTFVADHMTTITVTADDPDNDPLQYTWDIDEGGYLVISATANMLEMTNCCVVSQTDSTMVHAIVSDGNGGQARDSIRVWVVPGGGK